MYVCMYVCMYVRNKDVVVVVVVVEYYSTALHDTISCTDLKVRTNLACTAS